MKARAVALMIVCASSSYALGCGGGDDASSFAPDAGELDADAADAPVIEAPEGLDGDAIAAGDGADAIDAAEAGLSAATYLYTLRAAPFPSSGHPDVAVHVPEGFDPSGRVGAIVFFHGFDNCVANVIGAVDTACTPGSPTRSALHLVTQLEAARVNALLIAVQLRYDMATGDPGQLGKKGQLRALLHELLTEHLDAALGRSLDVGDLERVVIASHSGGYQAAAASISVGDVPQIREVDLYDSLYGNLAQYDAWMQGGIARFDGSRGDALRWADAFTTGGGTATNSRAMAGRAKTWLDAAALGASLFFDDTTATLAGPDYAHPVIFKLSGLAHVEVPRYYFGRLVASSGFAPLK